MLAQPGFRACNTRRMDVIGQGRATRIKTMYRHLLMRDEAGAVHRPIQDLAGARPLREDARHQHQPTSLHSAACLVLGRFCLLESSGTVKKNGQHRGCCAAALCMPRGASCDSPAGSAGSCTARTIRRPADRCRQFRLLFRAQVRSPRTRPCARPTQPCAIAPAPAPDARGLPV